MSGALVGIQLLVKPLHVPPGGVPEPQRSRSPLRRIEPSPHVPLKEISKGPAPVILPQADRGFPLEAQGCHLVLDVEGEARSKIEGAGSQLLGVGKLSGFGVGEGRHIVGIDGAHGDRDPSVDMEP